MSAQVAAASAMAAEKSTAMAAAWPYVEYMARWERQVERRQLFLRSYQFSRDADHHLSSRTRTRRVVWAGARRLRRAASAASAHASDSASAGPRRRSDTAPPPPVGPDAGSATATSPAPPPGRWRPSASASQVTSAERNGAKENQKACLGASAACFTCWLGRNGTEHQAVQTGRPWRRRDATFVWT